MRGPPTARCATLLSLCVLALGSTALVGQSPGDPRPLESEEAERGSALSLIKWASLALSSSAALYGFSLNSQAEDDFALLEAVCEADPDRCGAREPDGAFSDTELESRFQSILDKDRSARVWLVGAQIGLGATVGLFILDLAGAKPPDIPFEPRFRVGPTGLESVLVWRIGGGP